MGLWCRGLGVVGFWSFGLRDWGLGFRASGLGGLGLRV